MNRFSTWKETTKAKGQEFLKEQGPTIQEKANRVWKQAPSIPRFPPIPRTTPSKSADGAKIFVNMSHDVQEKAPPNRQESELTTSSAGDGENEASADTKTAGDPPGDDFEDLLNIEAKMGNALSKASKAATKASVAASVVAESMATNFRGRYNAKSGEAEEKQEEQEEKMFPHPSRSLPESQTELILKRRVG